MSVFGLATRSALAPQVSLHTRTCHVYRLQPCSHSLLTPSSLQKPAHSPRLFTVQRRLKPSISSSGPQTKAKETTRNASSNPSRLRMQPIKLYSHAIGPNPWKIAMMLNELELPFETEFVKRGETHGSEYLKVNPNGRVPAIFDPQTGITLWESGAIIEYLLDKYDQAGKMQPLEEPNKYIAKQWLFFQTSGQGPYFGQYAWFHMSHPEKLPSAQERYENEIRRQTKLLDEQLAGKEWLVGQSFTYVDLSLLPWYVVIAQPFAALDQELRDNYPNFRAWYDRLLARPAIKKTLDERINAIQTVPH